MDYFDILLAKKLSGGGGGEIVLEDITITENGEVTAPSGKAYKKITTNVPLPDNAYLLKEVEGLPKDIATFTDGSNLPMPNLKVAIEPIQSGSGDPSPSNVRPISGWSGANVSVCGKNLWGGEKLADDIVAKVPQATKDTTNKTVTYYASQVSGKPLFDKFKENTRYTIYLSTTSTYTNANILYSDGTYEAIEPNTYKVTYANKTVSEIRGAWASGTTVLKYEECGIFEGVITAQDFETYNGHTTTIPFLDSQGNPIEVFGGECDVVNGTSGNKKTLGYVDMGNPTWGYTNGRFYYNPTDAKVYEQTDVANMLCSQFPTSKYLSQADNSISCYAGYIYVRADSYNGDTTAFKQAMNGVQLVYELATPSTFYTQPTSIKSQSGVNNVWGDCGQITELSYFSKPSEG